MTLTPEEFSYGFVNTFSPEDAAAAYERYAVPETGQIFYEAGFANFHLHPPTELEFKNGERAPLLIVGAEKDHTVPPSVSRAQYKKYERSPAKTDYLEFEGRPHLFVVGEGWEEVAAAIDSWLDGVLDEPYADTTGLDVAARCWTPAHETVRRLDRRQTHLRPCERPLQAGARPSQPRVDVRRLSWVVSPLPETARPNRAAPRTITVRET